MKIQVELGEVAQNMRLARGAIGFNVDERHSRRGWRAFI